MAIVGGTLLSQYSHGMMAGYSESSRLDRARARRPPGAISDGWSHDAEHAGYDAWRELYFLRFDESCDDASGFAGLAAGRAGQQEK